VGEVKQTGGGKVFVPLFLKLSAVFAGQFSNNKPAFTDRSREVFNVASVVAVNTKGSQVIDSPLWIQNTTLHDFWIAL